VCVQCLRIGSGRTFGGLNKEYQVWAERGICCYLFQETELVRNTLDVWVVRIALDLVLISKNWPPGHEYEGICGLYGMIITAGPRLRSRYH
jgi:hypothetical protein